MEPSLYVGRGSAAPYTASPRGKLQALKSGTFAQLMRRCRSRGHPLLPELAPTLHYLVLSNAHNSGQVVYDLHNNGVAVTPINDPSKPRYLFELSLHQMSASLRGRDTVSL